MLLVWVMSSGEQREACTALSGTKQGKNIQTLGSSSAAKLSLLSTIRNRLGALLPWTPKHKHRMLLGFFIRTLTADRILAAQAAAKLPRNITK